MIAKVAAILTLFGVAQAGYLHGGSGLGYGSSLGYGVGHGSLGYGYGEAPAYSYSAPIVKTIAPVVSYAPAISSVSRYDIHSAPIVKSYVAPVASYGYSPSLSYGGYGSYGHGGYGHGSYGHGDYGYGGYGSKYLW